MVARDRSRSPASTETGDGGDGEHYFRFELAANYELEALLADLQGLTVGTSHTTQTV